MSATEEPQPAEAGPAPELDDANALRGHHFKLLMANPWTWAIVGFVVIAAGVAAGVFAKSAPLGGAGAAIVLLISIVAVFALADARAADSFFGAYAKERGMTLMDGRSRLPEATPFLRKGDDRYAERLLEGPLADGVQGRLATYTYEEKSYNKNGQETNYYRYTVGLVEVPESVRFLPELYCQRKSGLRALEGLEDAFRGSKERVKLESELLDRKYEIFSREGQDANWLRQLLSPSFIVWLIEKAPDKFAFELVNGTLCCYVNGHKENADALDRMREASATVATRLREESLE